MAGGPFHLTMPKIVGIKLMGKLQPWVSAKDVILEILKKVGVKGGVGKIFEYFGNGLNTLTIPERATITNMGTETGATTSIFPSDNLTKKWLESQQRVEEWTELIPSTKIKYEEIFEVNLDKIEPLIAQPHSPGNVATVKELKGMKVDQIAIGSCTNSSYKDLTTVANILKNRKVHPKVSLVISPGSRQVFQAITKNGALTDLISAGARILECTCGPCIGMGQAPSTNSVSLRTFNRNFEGRSGTKSAKVYLVSPEVAAVTSITGVLTDPRDFGEAPTISMQFRFDVDNSMIIQPSIKPEAVKIIRGPNIKPVPIQKSLALNINGEILLKVGDNITTDQIMPAWSHVLPLRSNIPAISKYVFNQVDPNFMNRAKAKKGGFILGGENYGQGSSREHAALAPMYLGIKGVIAKSFSRIHKINLVNFGILPLELINSKDYEELNQGDFLMMLGIRDLLKKGKSDVIVKNVTNGKTINLRLNISERFRKIIVAGGLMNFIKKLIKNND
jgi:aconitate hydratase